MKKLFLSLALALLIATPALAEPVVVTPHQSPFAWDEVTNPHEGESVEYNVYACRVGVPKDRAVRLGTVVTPESLFDGVTAGEGDWVVGVASVRVMADNTKLESEISWSDNTADTLNGETFIFRYFELLEKVKNLRF